MTFAIAGIAGVHGDRAEHTGNVGGRSISQKGASKRGDITCAISGEPGIVVECMDRAKNELTPKLVADELVAAMQNRGARAAIAVMSSSDNATMLGQPLQVLGTNMWAVVVQKEDPSLIAVQVAYKLARLVATAPTDRANVVDFEALKAAASEINGKLDLLKDVKTQLKNIADCRDKAWLSVSRLEREVGDAIRELLNSLEAQGQGRAVAA